MITLNRKVRFSHPDFTYTGTTYTEYLYGAIGFKVNADIRVDIHWEVEDVNMQFRASDDSIERLDDWSPSFIRDGFKAGDTITVSGTVSNNGSWTISTVEDKFIFVTGALTDEIVVSSIYGDTPIIAMDFYPNLIDNDSPLNLFNLTDRQTIPHYYADTITTDAANPTVMQVGTNSHGWVTPSDAATIYRLSFTNHIQTFVISHTFTITPIYLANQLTSLKNMQALNTGFIPAQGSYLDKLCLKYVYAIDGKYTALDPDPPHTSETIEFPKGQTGWFNEFMNGRPSTWTKQSITYSDNATGAGLSRIDYCKVVDVDARLMSQSATGNNTYIVQVMWLPRSESSYVNTATDYKTNFIYERALVSIGGATVQGENTGDYHFLKNVTATSVSANNPKIVFQIDFSQTLTDLFDVKSSDDLTYLIFITALNGATAAP
jgi:hypothetical protein